MGDKNKIKIKIKLRGFSGYIYFSKKKKSIILLKLSPKKNMRWMW